MSVRAPISVLAVLTLGILGAMLFVDARTFAFYAPDPLTGRGAGCWTAFDFVFGASEPSQLRSVELLTSLALLLVPLTVLSRAVCARLSNKRLKLAARVD